MGIAEVAALAIGFGNWVAICDLDSHGTVFVLRLPLNQYSEMVDDEETELFMQRPVTALDGIPMNLPLTGLRTKHTGSSVV